MVEKIENTVKQNALMLLLLLIAGGGGTFAGRLTAPSQDAKIAVLEERISQLCEMKVDFKNDLKLILMETQKIPSFDKRLEELSRRIQDLEKKISLYYDTQAIDRWVHKENYYGTMRNLPDRD